MLTRRVRRNTEEREEIVRMNLIDGLFSSFRSIEGSESQQRDVRFNGITINSLRSPTAMQI